MELPAPPSDPFAPFEPTDVAPWDRKRVNHLLRRAALGPSHERVKSMLAMTPGGAVDSLVNFDLANDPFNDMLDRMQGFFNFNQIAEVQNWCMFRMAGTPSPFQERMALFWHNHFATSASKVEQAQYMHTMMELFRQKGTGSFKDLLIAVSRDPAMLVWLDGQSNKRGHPNENFAREVMELFTLGIGNYQEQDIKELARAMTGWRIGEGKGVFNNKEWDENTKTIFGVTAKFDADSAIALILKQPAAPQHLAAKILREFVHPEPQQAHIDYVAGKLLENDWRVKPVLREIFTSRVFYSPWAYRSRIKSPIELVIGTIVAYGGKGNMDILTRGAARMGQNILFPPNVKGWDGNETWINANTVMVRFNFALQMASQQRAIFAVKPDLEDYMKAANAKTPEQIVDSLSHVLLDGWLSVQQKDQFVKFLTTVPNQKTPFQLPRDVNRLHELMHLMMTMPEYQLA